MPEPHEHAMPAWLANDPLARQELEAIVEVVKRGNPGEISNALGAVWTALDRGALWVASYQVNWPHTEETLAASTCTLLLPVLASHLRGVAALGRAGFDNLPTAMAASRAAFELGLRVAWVYAAASADERELRAAALHHNSSLLKAKVASQLDAAGIGGARWQEAADTHARIVNRQTKSTAPGASVPDLPSVYDRLRLRDLVRLYHAYQLASEYVHSETESAGELAAIRREQSPFGDYWPQDWYVAVNMCGWGCLFVMQTGDDEIDPRRVNGILWASEVLLAAPGP